ncbi:MAG: DoxX-like family protein [Pseudomonadales bacterium]
MNSLTIDFLGRWSLCALWLFTALTSSILAPQIGFDVLSEAGISGDAASAAVYGGSALDALLALWLIWGKRLALCYKLQFVTVLLYSALLSAISPDFWLHPFGPLTKNLPILVLIYVLAKLAHQRST